MPEENQLKVPLSVDTLLALKQGGFILLGTSTLASGTKEIEDTRIKANSIPLVTYNTFSSAGTLRAVTTKGKLTVTSSNGSDASEFHYLIII
jgi:hypothetical protein